NSRKCVRPTQECEQAMSDKESLFFLLGKLAEKDGAAPRSMYCAARTVAPVFSPLRMSIRPIADQAAVLDVIAVRIGGGQLVTRRKADQRACGEIPPHSPPSRSCCPWRCARRRQPCARSRRDRASRRARLIMETSNATDGPFIVPPFAPVSPHRNFKNKLNDARGYFSDIDRPKAGNSRRATPRSVINSRRFIRSPRRRGRVGYPGTVRPSALAVLRLMTSS